MYKISTSLLLIYSSISTWVKNCEKLDLDDTERASLEKFIDQLYDDIDRGMIKMNIKKVIV